MHWDSRRIFVISLLAYKGVTCFYRKIENENRFLKIVQLKLIVECTCVTSLTIKKKPSQQTCLLST